MKFNLKKLSFLLIVLLTAVAVILTSGENEIVSNNSVKRGSFDDFAFYLGSNTALENTYYKSDGSGGVTKTGASANEYNVYWDNDTNALIIKDLTLTTCVTDTAIIRNPSRSLFIAQKNLTDELELKVIFQGNINFSGCEYAHTVWDQQNPYGNRSKKLKVFIMEHQQINSSDQARFYASYSAGFYESHVKIVDGSFYFDAGTVSEDSALHAREHVTVDRAIVHAKARNHALRLDVSGYSDRLIYNGGKLILESTDQPYPLLGHGGSFYYYRVQEPANGEISKLSKKFTHWSETAYNVVLDENGNPVNRVVLSYLASADNASTAIYDLELDKTLFKVEDFNNKTELESELVENTKILLNAKTELDVSKYTIEYTNVPNLNAGKYNVDVTVKNLLGTTLIETTLSIKLIADPITEEPSPVPEVPDNDVEGPKSNIQLPIGVITSVVGAIIGIIFIILLMKKRKKKSENLPAVVVATSILAVPLEEQAYTNESIKLDTNKEIAVISEDSFDNRFSNKVYTDLRDLDFNVYEDLRYEDLQYKINNNLQTRAFICIVVKSNNIDDIIAEIYTANEKEITIIPHDNVVEYFLKKYR